MDIQLLIFFKERYTIRKIMIIIKKQLKAFLGLAAIGAVFIGAVVGGVLVKDRNSSKAKSTQTYNNSEDQFSQNSNIKANHQKICKDFFEENEQDLVLKGYSKKDVVDCSFVGCGGLF
jgi:hypothetical protein